MSSPPPPLHLLPEVSTYLAAFILVSHGLAALIVFFTPHLPWWLIVILCGLIIISLRHYWQLHISRKHVLAVTEAVFYSVDNWRIQTPKGGKFASLCDSSFINPWVCILNLRTAQTKRLHTLILLKDNVCADSLRRLRVRLKFSKSL